MSITLWKVLENNVFWHGDLDLWPMTLILKVDPDATKVHPHTKFRDPKSHTSRDMNFCLVNFYKVTDRRKAMHKSPPCISTDGLKKLKIPLWNCNSVTIIQQHQNRMRIADIRLSRTLSDFRQLCGTLEHSWRKSLKVFLGKRSPNMVVTIVHPPLSWVYFLLTIGNKTLFSADNSRMHS